MVVDSSTELSDDKIHKHVGDHLAKYKSLTGGIRRIDSIPKSAAGKILKKVLREEAAKEAAKVESVKHIEQPIPVDKIYFEHVEHVETVGPVENGPDVGKEALAIGNAIASSDELGIKLLANGNTGPESNMNGTADSKKRKHETSINGTTLHKKSKSLTDSIAVSSELMENGTRRSLRISGKVA